MRWKLRTKVMTGLSKTYQDTVLEPGFEQKAGPEWLKNFRRRSFEHFKQTGFPTRKMEAWKYMSLEPLLKMPVKNAQAAPAVFNPGTVEKEDIFVFWNGVYSQPLSSFRQIPANVKFGTLSSGRFESAGIENLFGSGQAEENPFAAINSFQFEDAFVFWVPQGTVLPEPVRFIFRSSPESSASPRILIVMGAGSKAEVLFDFAGKESSAVVNMSVQVRLEPNANLTAALVQRSGEGTVQFLNARVSQAEGSSLEWVSFSSGGKMTRNEIVVNFEGENAFASLNGLALLDGTSQVFQHAFVHHQKPHCTSRQIFKNILAGSSAAEFDSLVHVWKNGAKSDSEQLDKNLLLSKQARAWSRPQLKIDTDDVKASHGAATGQLEQNELFYLRSRGLSKKAARFLITYGFAEEVLQKIGHAALRKELEDFASRQIEHMTAEL